MQKVVLLDMDEVVVDLVGRWLEVYNKEYDDNMSLDDFCYDWDIDKRVKCGNAVYDIIKRDHFFEDLPAIEGAIEGVRLLHKKTNLLIVTSISACAEIAKGKVLWVEKYLPFFKINNMIMCRQKSLIRGDIMIDDGMHMLAEWKTINPDGKAILMDAPHNRFPVPFEHVRVFDWIDITKEVLRNI